MLHKIIVNPQVREIEIAASELISIHYDIAIAILGNWIWANCEDAIKRVS